MYLFKNQCENRSKKDRPKKLVNVGNSRDKEIQEPKFSLIEKLKNILDNEKRDLDSVKITKSSNSDSYIDEIKIDVLKYKRDSVIENLETHRNHLKEEK